MKKHDENTAVFVLGMHRSGTSALARGLIAIGIDWGTNLLAGEADNPKGFWEDKDLHKINRLILSHYSLDGEFAFSMGGRIDFSLIDKSIIEEVKTFIKNKALKEGGLWGCKDPRCCLTFPVWKKHLVEQNTIPKCIMIIRNPLDVALSLNARNGFSIDKGVMLWFSYNYAILQNAFDSIETIVQYEDLLEHPNATLEKISDSLGIDPRSFTEEIFEFEKKFLSRDLCHHASTLTQLQDAFSQKKEVIELYKSLLDLSKKKHIVSSDIKLILNRVQGFGLLNEYLSAIPTLELNHIVKKSIAHSLCRFQVFINTGAGFSEMGSKIKTINLNEFEKGVRVEIDEVKPVKVIRVDPCTQQCIVEFNQLEVESSNGKKSTLRPTHSNAFLESGNRYYFNHDDPQLFFELNERICSVTAYLKIFLSTDDILQEMISKLKVHSNSKEIQVAQLQKTLVKEKDQIEFLKNESRRYQLKSEHLKEEVDDALFKSEQANLQTEKIKRSLAQAEQKTEQANLQTEKIKRSLAQAEQKTEQANLQTEQLRRSLAQAEQKTEQANLQTEQLRRSLAQAEQKTEQANLQTEQLRRSLAQAEQKTEQATLKTEQLRRSLAQAEQKTEQATLKTEKLKRSLAQAKQKEKQLNRKTHKLHLFADDCSQQLHYIKSAAIFNFAFDFVRYIGCIIATRKDCGIIEKSGLFDNDYYCKKQGSVSELKCSPVKHFVIKGWKERLNPSCAFNTQYYLSKYEDVSSCHMNPFIHYIKQGKEEGRFTNIDEEEISLLLNNDLFDEKYYLKRNPHIDGESSNPNSQDAAEHYYYYGWKEGKNPSEVFDTKYYLSKYEDAAASNMNPLIHYIKHGKEEGRFTNIDEEEISLLLNNDLFDEKYYLKSNPDINGESSSPNSQDAAEHYYYYGWKEGKNPSEVFDTKYYLSKYEDVAASAMNPLLHYILTGYSENRYTTRDKNIHILGSSQFFDAEYYLKNHPGIGNGSSPIDSQDAAEHYYYQGWKEGKNPSELFDTKYYLTMYEDVAASSMNPLLHYILTGCSENRYTTKDMENIHIIGSSQFFDAEYYLRNHPDSQDAAEHYYYQGWKEGKNPSKVFDTKYYLSMYEDVAASAMNPLLHYILIGYSENRYTTRNMENIHIIGSSQFFDAEYYLRNHPDSQDAVEHYYYHGWKEGKNPSELFDTKYYLSMYEDVAASAMNPLLHYILTGCSENRYTTRDMEIIHILGSSQFFDAEYYIKNHPGIKNGSSPIDSQDAAEHYYYHGWKEGKDPSEVFDTKYYLSMYEDVAASAMNPLLHYILIGYSENRYTTRDMENIHILGSSQFFDAEYYLRNHPDSQDAAEHYYYHGWKEGKNPSELFDTKYYLSMYEDVAASDMNPLLHYILIGRSEERFPTKDMEVIAFLASSDLFDAEHYLKHNPEILGGSTNVEKIDAAAHYYYHGWREGRNPSELFDTNYYLETYEDIGKAGVNPLWHYLSSGHAEERSIIDSRSKLKDEKILDEKLLYDPVEFYEEEKIVSQLTDDIKLIAYHLPQFHRMQENDDWWGEGFTEWTNVKAAKPLFDRQYQPRIPHDDIGYYDLTDIKSIKKQVELANNHGIYGFCFYYYWFSGKRLMEKPIDIILEHPEIKLNYCLCWANESWTKKWDGQENEILIKQEYSAENDIAFISDLSKYVQDPRYIRYNNKPVILIYRADHLPEPKETTRRLRRWCRENGIGEILLLTSFINEIGDPVSLGFDAAIERPFYNWEIGKIRNRKAQFVENEDHSGVVYTHEEAVDFYSNPIFSQKEFKIFRALNAMWDPSSRHQDRCHIVHLAKPGEYQRWLDHTIVDTRLSSPKEERFVFINAWNEWAEGTYLEPDQSFGYAMLNATGRALQPYELWINCVKGGGTKSYIDRSIQKSKQDKNHIVWNIHSGEAEINGHDNINLNKNMNDVVKRFNITLITIVSLVYDENVFRTLREVTLLKKENPSVNIKYQFHDYYGICPSLNLLDNDMNFCNVPEEEHICLACLEYSQIKFCDEKNISLWRLAWKEMLDAIDEIQVFSKSSLKIVAKTYPDLKGKVILKPHNLDYLKKLRIPKIQMKSLHLGFLGDTLDHKGLGVLTSLLPELKRQNIPITIIGEKNQEVDSYFTFTGRYDLSELPDIIEELSVNVFLQVSICPETFCYTVAELIHMQAPVICFDLGGQADLMKTYPNGKILPLNNKEKPESLLKSINQFFIEMVNSNTITTTVLF